MTEQSYTQIALPSNCITYPDTKPENVKIRTFTGAEEELLADTTSINFERKFLSVLKRVLQGVDVDKLTLGDKDYVMTWEAINSFSDKSTVNIICESCLLKIQIEYKLSELEVIVLPDSYKEPYKITLSDGQIVRVRLQTVQDEINVAEFEQKGQSSYIYTYAVCIVDDSKDIIQKMEFLKGLLSKDLGRIRAFHEKYFHGPRFETKYVCPKCNGEGNASVPFRFDQILPYGATLVSAFGEKI